MRRLATIGGGAALALAAAHAIGQTPAAPPPGPALAVINDRCGTCHSTASVFNQRRTPDDWAATVQLMVDRGADLTPDDMNGVIDYLAANYGPPPAKPASTK